MQERVIENWLTNANELSFTVPFSQILALQGHKILHISPKKATLEQGKDIISIDGSGTVHCYQLKGGDITLKRWRDEVKPEVEAMVDLPPQHPSLGSVRDWTCHLVVNGDFKGEAAREVVDTQRARIADGRRSFRSVVRGELLNLFTGAYGEYLPREPADFASFIDLYREPGLEPLSKLAFSKFLELSFSSSLSTSSDAPTRNEIRQQINAAIVSTSYLLSGKIKEQNHVAVIEGWLSLLGYVFAVADKQNLDEKNWRPGVDLIEQIIGETMSDLLEELESREHYAQPAPNIYADAYVYKLRVSMVAGYVSAYLVGAYKRRRQLPQKSETLTFLNDALTKRLLILMGEGQIPLLACTALLYDLVGEKQRAIDLVRQASDYIIEGCKLGGVFDPYIDAQEIIRSELAMTPFPLECRSGRSSFTLEGLILLSAYLGDREYLERNWRPISHIAMQTFIPNPSWQWTYWHCEEGKQEARFPKQTESWRALVEHARNGDGIPMSSLLLREASWIPLFWCLMPHRFSGYSLRAFLAD